MAPKVLSAVEILEADDVKFDNVEIPEWGGCVRLRTLTGEEAVVFADASKDRNSEAAALLLSMSAVDENGKNIFNKDHVQKLKKKSLRAIIRLQNAALVLNGLKEEPADVKND